MGQVHALRPDFPGGERTAVRRELATKAQVPGKEKNDHFRTPVARAQGIYCALASFSSPPMNRSF
jgi:hypothetical protein